MTKLAKILLIANLLVLFAYVFYQVSRNETLLRDGDLILLDLAPADPRSLLQGDYMRLEYAVGRDILSQVASEDRYVVVAPDSLGVARFVRTQSTTETQADQERVLAFERSGRQVKLGPESYFFQEGRASDFDRARYGGLVVGEDLRVLLVGLYDEGRVRIE